MNQNGCFTVSLRDLLGYSHKLCVDFRVMHPAVLLGISAKILSLCNIYMNISVEILMCQFLLKRRNQLPRTYIFTRTRLSFFFGKWASSEAPSNEIHMCKFSRKSMSPRWFSANLRNFLLLLKILIRHLRRNTNFFFKLLNLHVQKALFFICFLFI